MSKRICFLIAIMFCCHYAHAGEAAKEFFDCGVVDSGLEKKQSARPVGISAAEVLDSTPLRDPDLEWVETTLSGMTLDEKIGQMIMPWYSYSSPTQISDYHIGGFVFSSFNTSGAASVVNTVNSLQAISTIPLWFSADFECGAGARFGDATVFPMNMALGAANDEVLAASQGWVTARESWALGIQIGFGPDVDVNTAPENLIIGTRSYSDDQARVATMAQALLSGAREAGMLTCLKHYPGHGPTENDSHTSMPVCELPEVDLRSVHLFPYSQLIQGGYADLVMSAHVWYKSLDPGVNPWPATYSKRAMTEILRTDFGFTGVSISDAFNMAGADCGLTEEEAVVTAVKNGLDIILIPKTISTTFNALKTAVSSGEIASASIDQSVRRILTAKSRAWLPEYRYRDEMTMWGVLQHPEHLEIADSIARKAVTRYWEESGVLPLEVADNVLSIRLADGGIIFNSPSRPYTSFTDPLALALPNFDTVVTSRTIQNSEMNQLISQAGNYDRIVVSCYDWKPIMTDSQVQLVNTLIDGSVPVVFISFGSPYHALKLPDLGTFYCAYSNAECSQKAGADALLGVLEPVGSRPVSVYPSDVNSVLMQAY